MMCDPCNSQSGSRWIAQLKRDPAIVLAIDAVAPSLPGRVRDAVTEGQRRIIEGPDGKPVFIERKKGKDAIVTRRVDDGSIMSDPSTAHAVYEGLLRKNGALDEEVAEFRRAVESAQEGEVVHGRGVSVVSRPVEKVEPDLSGKLVDERAAAVIAFGYMGLLVGNDICTPYFDPVRNWLRGDDKAMNIDVERLWARKYSTQHSLAGRQEGDDDFVVQVILFGGVVFNIRFRNIVVGGDHQVYVEDLEKEEGLLAGSLDAASRGEFFLIR
jgi:hypothetical protein